MGKFTEQWDQLKPEKPKRAPNKFARFVSDFSKKSPPANKAADLIVNASHAWENLDEEEKQQFENHDQKEQCKREMVEYKARMTAMKNPPGTYALYTRQYWQENNPRLPGSQKRRREQFGRIGRDIAVTWRRKTVEEKSVYREASNLLKSLFEQEQEAVINQRRPLNLNWLNDGLQQTTELMRKRQRPEPNAPPLDIE